MITSGQAVLYDASGNLVFSGDITGSWGREGTNAGREAIESILRGDEPSTRNTPVFGCVLTSSVINFN